MGSGLRSLRADNLNTPEKALESNLYPLLLNSWKGHGCDLFKNKRAVAPIIVAYILLL